MLTSFPALLCITRVSCRITLSEEHRFRPPEVFMKEIKRDPEQQTLIIEPPSGNIGRNGESRLDLARDAHVPENSASIMNDARRLAFFNRGPGVYFKDFGTGLLPKRAEIAATLCFAQTIIGLGPVKK